MFAFILEGLGSTELIFILVVALIFFGPRKLPQLARSMGKGLSEFRKASDDFKRTWEREVALEGARAEDNSVLDLEQEQASYEATETVDPPLVEPANSDLVVARDSSVEITPEAATLDHAPEPVQVSSETVPPDAQPMRKQDWL